MRPEVHTIRENSYRWARSDWHQYSIKREGSPPCLDVFWPDCGSRANLRTGPAAPASRRSSGVPTRNVVPRWDALQLGARATVATTTPLRGY